MCTQLTVTRRHIDTYTVFSARFDAHELVREDPVVRAYGKLFLHVFSELDQVALTLLHVLLIIQVLQGFVQRLDLYVR
jgi:hypothetical protein